MGLPKLPEWNPRPVYLSSFIGLGAVAFVQTLSGFGILAPALPHGAGSAAGNPSAMGCNSDILLLLPLALGIAWVGLEVESRIWRAIVLGGALLQLLLASILSARYGVAFSPVSPSVCLFLAWSVPEWLRKIGPATAAELDFQFDKTGAVREQKDLPTPSKTVPATAESAEGSTLPPAPVRANCTVMFCAIVNHAQFVDNLQPAQCAWFLKRLLKVCAETTAFYRGRADRADGETFRAVFSPLLGAEEHPEAALQAAAAIRQRAASLSQECETKFGLELDIRIGVSTGEILIADLGDGEERMSLLGEAADWARKLAAANTLYGTRILMSAQTALLGGYTVERRPIDLLQRKLPPHLPEDVFELVALHDTLDSEAMARLSKYRKGVAQLRARNWEAARASLVSARPTDRTDEAIELLLQRIAENEARAPRPKHPEALLPAK